MKRKRSLPASEITIELVTKFAERTKMTVKAALELLVVLALEK